MKFDHKKNERSFLDDHEFKPESKPINYFFIICLIAFGVVSMTNLIYRYF